MEIFPRITANPAQCGGRPCVRGMRIRVSDVLDLLETGMTFHQIVEEMPDLEEADIRACIAFAKQGVQHTVIAVSTTRGSAK
jgi:uncharacterized protein (DUF433 family)